MGALGHLAHQPELSYSDLARRAGITPQSMRATVLQLEDMGAVRRTLAGRGRRAALEVTEQGRELLTWAGDVVAGLDDELFGDLTSKQRSTIRQFLVALALPG